ncbi:MAG TPA: NAD-dependent deacylase [Gemmatimonadales bacterium]|nr:NAD-dependent deacylase [Gemmatimonadales bacterium]
MREDPTIAAARALLDRAPRVLVFTGAGISADSGLPTFRGADGLWRRFRPEELATPDAFRRDPRLVWEWYAWRRERIAACRPNAAHLAVARWMMRRDGVTLVTQNVDGLHEEAARETASETGGDPARAAPIGLHGSIFRLRCTRCPERRDHRGPIDTADERTLPHCGTCGALLRPDVVWFGEPLPEAELSRATRAASGADACLVIGTRGAVHPAAGLVLLARRRGARIAVVDPGETAFDAVADVRLHLRAAQGVPLILG